jgi:TolB protein
LIDAQLFILIWHHNKMMKFYCLLIGVFISLIFVSCHKDEVGDFYSGESKILYIARISENSSDWSLLAMSRDGSNESKITDLTVRCEKPVVSQSGKAVLFVHNTDDFYYELYYINVDGSNLTLIDRSKRYCGMADWSFDDSKIVYSKCTDENSNQNSLILYDVTSKTKVVLDNTANCVVGKFSKSNQIAYTRQENDNSCNIYRINTNGTNKVKVVSNAYSPVWSPDATKIAYISTIENGSSQIFVANSNGAQVKQLTSTYSPRIWPGWPPDGNYDPQWSPDGRKLVYVSCQNEAPDIYIMNADGSGQKRLTTDDGRDEDPEINSTGKYILFSSTRNPGNNADIFIMDIDGKNQKPLTDHIGSDIYPVEIE